MTAPIEGAKVPKEHAMLRLPLPPPDFVPDSFAPSGALFVLSSAERQGNGRLSAWDESLTTVEQAKALRGRPQVVVLRAYCGDLIQAGGSCGKPVAVVYDPLPPPQNQRPGAEGHAGIVGLLRPQGASRAEYRRLREAIADCFSLLA